MNNESDVNKAFAEKFGVKEELADEMGDFLQAKYLETALEHGQCKLHGFGKFEVKERAARKGRNPRTGEEIDIPASKYLKFSAYTATKKRVKES